MRFVELKCQAQLDMQTLHRARDRLVGERTALINQLRAILLERGIVVAKGRRKLEMALDAMLTEPDGLQLTPRILELVQDMRAEWRALDQRITAFGDEFAARARTDEPARLLSTIPASASSMQPRWSRRSDGARHSTAPETCRLGLASWLAKTPLAANRVSSASPSEGTDIFANCSFTGRGLRCLRSRKATRHSALGCEVCWPVAHNVVVVALANKLARIAWAVLRTGRPYHTNAVVSA